MATYYIATTGSDSADGSELTPWLTIQKAADTVTAGDTINVAAGTYYETVHLDNNAGTELSRVEFIGAVDAAGRPTTIVDGSVSAAGVTWVQQPLVHEDCYYAAIGNAWLMTLDDKEVMRVGEDSQTPWADFFSVDEYMWSDSYIPGQMAVDFWDVLPVAYACETGTAGVYLRFADGSHPSANNLRYSPTRYATINIYKHDARVPNYITIKNMEIRGGGYGLTATNCTGTTVDNCWFPHGPCRIRLISAPDMTIKNCKMWFDHSSAKAAHAQWYGYNVPNEHAALAEFTRGMHKAWTYGDSGNGNDGIYTFSRDDIGYMVYCENLLIEDCTFEQINIGLLLSGVDGGMVRRCTFDGSSNGHIYCMPQSTDVVVEDCTLYNCTHSIRYHLMDDDDPRSWTFRRCVLWDPRSTEGTGSNGRIGRGMIMHHSSQGAPPQTPVVTFEDCAFIDFQLVFFIDSALALDYRTTEETTFTGCLMLTDDVSDATPGFDADPLIFKEWSDNVMIGLTYNYGRPAWLGASNHDLTPANCGAHLSAWLAANAWAVDYVRIAYLRGGVGSVLQATPDNIEAVATVAQPGDTIELAAGVYQDRRIPNQDGGMNVALKPLAGVDVVSWGLVGSNWLSAALFKTHEDPDSERLAWP